MSRVGKKPILIPEGVEIKIEGRKMIVKGPKGELSRDIPLGIEVEKKDLNSPGAPEEKKKAIFVSSKSEAKKNLALWGLTRALLANMVKGVTEGYEKKLEIEGVGFKALIENEDLVLFVGFTNPIRIKAPEGVKFLTEKNLITVSGIDIEKVSQLAAKIRKIKPPEPYKGKGIRYLGEVIRRKAGKKVVTAG